MDSTIKYTSGILRGLFWLRVAISISTFPNRTPVSRWRVGVVDGISGFVANYKDITSSASLVLDIEITVQIIVIQFGVPVCKGGSKALVGIARLRHSRHN